MKPHSIRLFVKAYCGWCHEVIDWLDERHISFESLDVSTDAAAFKEMVALSGQSKAPVIEVDGKILADFGADELEAWWEKNDFGSV
jgi:glutaredoxin 3